MRSAPNVKDHPSIRYERAEIPVNDADQAWHQSINGSFATITIHVQIGENVHSAGQIQEHAGPVVLYHLVSRIVSDSPVHERLVIRVEQRSFV